MSLQFSPQYIHAISRISQFEIEILRNRKLVRLIQLAISRSSFSFSRQWETRGNVNGKEINHLEIQSASTLLQNAATRWVFRPVQRSRARIHIAFIVWKCRQWIFVYCISMHDFTYDDPGNFSIDTNMNREKKESMQERWCIRFN